MSQSSILRHKVAFNESIRIVAAKVGRCRPCSLLHFTTLILVRCEVTNEIGDITQTARAETFPKKGSCNLD